MTISVIIPTLNEEKRLEQTLASLATSNFLDIIIVDGGSTDTTVSIADAFRTGNPNCHVLTGSAGRARQMNQGAKSGRGETFLFLHADTLLPPHAHLIIESALTDTRILGGRFDVRFDAPSVWGNVVSRLMNWRSRLSGIATGDQAIFVRRHAFEQLGGFPDIPLMEDIDFSRKLKRLGPTVALRQTVTTSFRRWKQQGALKTILLMWTLRFLYWVRVSPHRLTRFYRAVR